MKWESAVIYRATVESCFVPKILVQYLYNTCTIRSDMYRPLSLARQFQQALTAHPNLTINKENANIVRDV